MIGEECLRCPVCKEPLSFRIAKGRKSGKPFLMMICPTDGRHFRGFITYRPYLETVLSNLETIQTKTDE
jgi:hypothetical protein